ncbi:hypothetical protein TNCT_539031 [Trichonephila clavata]|uniref:Uncharacterized protein n=1 Tax=Trichonephila clavata TaxID=2740835 RepID=A0A8X6KPG9_TRICU|nr:hypothetical protein TNCT_539031 [Trichonephila clavata]
MYAIRWIHSGEQPSEVPRSLNDSNEDIPFDRMITKLFHSIISRLWNSYQNELKCHEDLVVDILRFQPPVRIVSASASLALSREFKPSTLDVTFYNNLRRHQE